MLCIENIEKLPMRTIKSSYRQLFLYYIQKQTTSWAGN